MFEKVYKNVYFNPRSPYGERPKDRMPKIAESYISIHAPLTGSDRCASPLPKAGEYFNPRSPYGERLQLYVPFSLFGVISIHAPLTGSDVC